MQSGKGGKKRHSDQTGNKTLLICRQHNPVFKTNPRELTKRTTSINQVTGYKINTLIEKSIVFLYISEHMGMGINIKNTIPFIITQKLNA